MIVFGAAVVSAGSVEAFEIATGRDDVRIRWDHTIRYNLARRVEEQDAKIIGSLNSNDGDRNFEEGSLVSNRIDELSEFDVVYRKAHGFRVSAAMWGDEAYDDIDVHSAAGSNHLENGVPATGLSRTTKRYNRGVSGEWLDVFAFTKLDIGDSPLYLKAGQHTVYWGESLFLGGVANGVACALLRSIPYEKTDASTPTVFSANFFVRSGSSVAPVKASRPAPSYKNWREAIVCLGMSLRL